MMTAKPAAHSDHYRPHAYRLWLASVIVDSKLLRLISLQADPPSTVCENTMKKLAVTLILGISVSACSPVPFKILSKPTAVSEDTQKLDDIQCSNASRVNGPWLFGIGTLTYRRMAASNYEKCMNAKGYKVEEQ